MSSIRLSLVCFVASSLSLAAAQQEQPVPQKNSRGIWSSFVGGLKTVADGAGAVAKTASGAVGRVFDFSGPKHPGLKLEMTYGANPVRPERGGFFPVRLQLFNTGKKTRLLEFPSVQRAEAVIRESGGKIVSRASVTTGQEAGMVTLNPGERIEFLLRLPSQDVVAGKPYTLEAAITGNAGLVAKEPIRVAD